MSNFVFIDISFVFIGISSSLFVRWKFIVWFGRDTEDQVSKQNIVIKKLLFDT